MQLIIIPNSLDEGSWKFIETDDFNASLVEYFGDQFPSNAELYRDEVAECNVITPHTAADVEFLRAAPYTRVYCVVMPEGPLTPFIPYIIAALVVIAAIVFRPKLPNAALPNQSAQSGNNDLGSRENKPRINGRIPDIFGTVRSYPDLIAAPYSQFVNQVEVETINFCIGRGEYTYADVQDGDTDTAQIEDMSVQFYGPGKNASTHSPDVQLGEFIDEPVYNVNRANSVNGQTILPPNSGNYTGDAYFGGGRPNNEVHFPLGSDITSLFAVGDSVSVTTGTWYDPDTVHGITLTGSGYIVSAVGETFIRLVNPSTIDPDWAFISVDHTEPGTVITKTATQWFGPYDVTTIQATELWFNFVALQGLYKSDTGGQQAITVTLEIHVQRLTSGGAPTGSPFLSTVLFYGSGVSTGERRQTHKIDGLAPGFFRVKVRRVSNHDYTFDGQVNDEVKWRDLYAVAEVNVDYGNVTTGQARVVGTKSALAVKNRELNLLASRKIKTRSLTSPYNYNVGLAASKNVADIIDHIVQDPYLGNRPLSELDFANLYATSNAVSTYFGTSQAREFSFTFDSLDMTFEDTLATVSQAAFLTAYRQGRKFRFNFRKKETASKLLFNSRNVKPGSMSIKSQFGRQKAYDGVEFTYVSPDDSTTTTLYIPADRSATNPDSIESVGIRSHRQAWFHAYRSWNEIQYRNKAVAFEALSESELLVTNDRIMVADLVRAATISGQVNSVAGLVLEVSQPVTLPAGTHTIFLQLANGTTQGINVTQGADAYHVILGSAPAVSLVAADDRFVKTLYTIALAGNTRRDLYIVTEREYQGEMVSRVSAMNYDDRYYNNDLDFINGLIP